MDVPNGLEQSAFKVERRRLRTEASAFKEIGRKILGNARNVYRPIHENASLQLKIT